MDNWNNKRVSALVKVGNMKVSWPKKASWDS